MSAQIYKEGKSTIEVGGEKYNLDPIKMSNYNYKIKTPISGGTSLVFEVDQKNKSCEVSSLSSKVSETSYGTIPKTIMNTGDQEYLGGGYTIRLNDITIPYPGSPSEAIIEISYYNTSIKKVKIKPNSTQEIEFNGYKATVKVYDVAAGLLGVGYAEIEASLSYQQKGTEIFSSGDMILSTSNLFASDNSMIVVIKSVDTTNKEVVLSITSPEGTKDVTLKEGESEIITLSEGILLPNEKFRTKLIAVNPDGTVEIENAIVELKSGKKVPSFSDQEFYAGISTVKGPVTLELAGGFRRRIEELTGTELDKLDIKDDHI